MLIVRLVHLKEMPSYEEVIDSLKSNDLEKIEKNKGYKIEKDFKKKVIIDESQKNNISKDQIKNPIQTKPTLLTSKEEKSESNLKVENILSFEDIIYLSGKKKRLFAFPNAVAMKESH